MLCNLSTKINTVNMFVFQCWQHCTRVKHCFLGRNGAGGKIAVCTLHWILHCFRHLHQSPNLLFTIQLQHNKITRQKLQKCQNIKNKFIFTRDTNTRYFRSTWKTCRTLCRRTTSFCCTCKYSRRT